MAGIWLLDSRGVPTLKATVRLSDGSQGEASVPRGASRGKHEAQDLRDNDPRCWQGQGVKKALKNINRLATILRGRNLEPDKLDNLLITSDGTANKSHLGANALLAISLAMARAAAAAAKLPLYRWLNKFYFPETKLKTLPAPLMNFLNGGRHAFPGPDFQEFMIIPQQTSFTQKLIAASNVYSQLKTLLRRRRWPTTVGDEGGFAPPVANNEEAIKLLLNAIEKAGYQPGKDFDLALDAAASQLYRVGRYWLSREGRQLPPAKLFRLYQQWSQKYPLKIIEDGFDEEAWDDFHHLTARLGKTVKIVGDDLYATNIKRLKIGIQRRATNAVLIKPNQIGTLKETVEFIRLARQAKQTIIISHRSGETCDSFIADLAVAAQAEYIKAGALARSERLAKYNRLLAIEHQLAV